VILVVLTIKQKHQLKRFIRKLEVIRGRHTELVSVYIPAGYDMNKIINHLSQEQGTAANIKDKTTRTHVIDSLERMIRHLRLFKKTPDNGLAVFSGDASEREGKPDIQVWSIEPPEPLNLRMYRCDQSFKIEPLKALMEYKETYGLIVVDRREGNIGLLKGTNITLVTTMTSGVPGKTRAGGQCLHPDTIVHMADGQFLRIEEVEKGDEVLSFNLETKQIISSKITKKWITPKDKIYRFSAGEEIIASADHIFFMEDGTTKPAEELKQGDMLLAENGQGKEITTIQSEEKPMELIDISVENENFIAEGLVVHNSAQRFARIREGAAKEFYKRIAEAAQKEFLGMENLKGILVGGPGPTKEQFLNLGYLNEELKRKVIGVIDLSYTGEFGLQELVEKSADILVKEAITEEKEIMQRFFKLLATEPGKVSYGFEAVKKALGMGAVDKLLISEGLDDEKTDELEEEAENQGTDLQIISTDSAEGTQLRDLGGVAAILRFSIE
jgi:peptide subunit release factor 1 (eRF1)